MSRAARIIKPLSLFFVLCAIVQCKKRQGVVVVGTTMGPNYSVKQGKQASLCPTSHPWVLNNGSSCCSTYQRVSSHDKLLDFYDPLSECSGQDIIPCPQEYGRGVCKFVLAKPTACARNYAFYGTLGGCCRTRNKIYDTSLNPSCDGKAWKNGHFKSPQDRDPDVCCPEGSFFPVAACQSGTTFCGIPFSKAPPIPKSAWKVTSTQYYGNLKTQNAIDDRLDTWYAIASPNAQAWLQIEFPIPILVTKIHHYKRDDNESFKIRTADMEYRVGDTPVVGSFQIISINEVCGMTPAGFEDEFQYTVICHTPLMGTYLTMQQKSNLKHWDVREIYIE